MKAVLNPPRRFVKSRLPNRLRVRYKRLIGLLEGESDIKNDQFGALEDLQAIQQCQFVFTPVPMPNLIILGETVPTKG